MAKLRDFEAPGIFTRINPAVYNQLPANSEVRERIDGCTHFCRQVSVKEPGENQSVALASRKFLRAALAEFASLDEAAKLDKDAGRLSSAPKMTTSDDPRIHVVRLLRHANVHLCASVMDTTMRPATWTGPDGEVTFDYHVFYVPSLAASVGETNYANHYEPIQLTRMINWIELQQMNWGINHLVLRTAELYVRSLL